MAKNKAHNTHLQSGTADGDFSGGCRARVGRVEAGGAGVLALGHNTKHVRGHGKQRSVQTVFAQCDVDE